MASETLQFSRKLREAYPELCGPVQSIRIKTVKRAGRTVYQLLYEEGGKAKAPQLTASDALSAYEEARALLAAILNGDEKPTSSGRLPPTGHIRRAERKARVEYEKRDTSDKTFDQNIRYLERLTGWFGENSKPLSSETLLEYIATTDQQKRDRRGAIQAAKMIAEVEGITLKTPSRMHYLVPAEKDIKLTDLEKKVIYATLDNMDKWVAPWIAWIYRVAACTGCRANVVFGMDIPARPFNRDFENLQYFDTKRQLSKAKILNIKPLTMLFAKDMPAFWRLRNNHIPPNADMFNVWKLYEIPEEIKKMRIIGRPPSKEELKARNDKITFAMDTFRRACKKNDFDIAIRPPESLSKNDDVPLVGFRTMRKLCVMRMIQMGHDAYDIEEQIASSKKEIERVYSSIYKKDYHSRARKVISTKAPETEASLLQKDARLRADMSHEMATMAQRNAKRAEHPQLTEKEQEMLKRFEEKAKLLDQANA